MVKRKESMVDEAIWTDEFETLVKELEDVGLEAEGKRLRAVIKTAGAKHASTFAKRVTMQTLAAYFPEMIASVKEGRQPDLPPQIMSEYAKDGYEEISREIAKKMVEGGGMKGILEELVKARDLMEKSLKHLNAYLETVQG